MDWFLQSRQHFELFVWMVLGVGSAIAAIAVAVARWQDGQRRQVLRFAVVAVLLAAVTGVTLSADQELYNYCKGLEPYSFWWWAGGCWGL